MNNVKNKIKDELSEKFNIDFVFTNEMERFAKEQSYVEKVSIANEIIEQLKKKI